MCMVTQPLPILALPVCLPLLFLVRGGLPHVIKVCHGQGRHEGVPPAHRDDHGGGGVIGQAVVLKQHADVFRLQRHSENETDCFPPPTALESMYSMTEDR